MNNLSYIKENMNSKTLNEIGKTLSISVKKIKKIIKENDLKRLPELLKKCPFCNNFIEYSNDSTYVNSIKRGSRCQQCLIKIRSQNAKGEKNPFYGKKHTPETIVKISKLKKGIKLTHSGSFKKGEIHNTRSIYDCWINRYGKVKADEKMITYRKKLSIVNSGVNNNMYGKPSPIGSGNGWSGWYKGWYFRSLLELSYMINIIERFNLKWEKGEQKKYRIPYINEVNEVRNYFPDFVINNKYIIECKPRSLQNLKINLLKKDGAIDFCNNNNMLYKIKDCEKITISELTVLYNNGLVKLTKKYKNKFLKIINK